MSSFGVLTPPNAPVPAVEFCLLRLPEVCTLHLLFTLSERLIIALCTNPPMPLVGDGVRSGNIRPMDGDMAVFRSDGPCSVSSGSEGGGRNLCDSSMGSGDLISDAL